MGSITPSDFSSIHLSIVILLIDHNADSVPLTFKAEISNCQFPLPQVEGFSDTSFQRFAGNIQTLVC